jgi:hypothetical protein
VVELEWFAAVELVGEVAFLASDAQSTDRHRTRRGASSEQPREPSGRLLHDLLVAQMGTAVVPTDAYAPRQTHGVSVADRITVEAVAPLVHPRRGVDPKDYAAGEPPRAWRVQDVIEPVEGRVPVLQDRYTVAQRLGLVGEPQQKELDDPGAL